MSRIFDALRQSEKDKLAGSERWSLPDLPKPDPTLSTMPDAVEQSTQTVSEAPATAQPAQSLGENVPQDTVEQIRQAVTPEDVTSRIAELARSLQSVKGRMDTPAAEPSVAYPTFSIPTPAPSIAPTLSPTESGRAGAARTESNIDFSKLKAIDPVCISSPLVVALNNERELGAEKYRVLCARLMNMRMGANLKILQVTSSIVGEGKTLTSVNLALTFAKRFAQKVLLVEGDLRKPAICELLRQKRMLGIGEWFQEQDSPISDFIVRIGDIGVGVLPAGNVPHPASVLQSQHTSEMIHQIADSFDWVVIDTPPLLPMADSNMWSRVSDGTLLVVRKGTVTRAALKRAVESIDNPKFVGVVLNDASDFDRVNYYSQYSTIGGEGTSRKAAGR